NRAQLMGAVEDLLTYSSMKQKSSPEGQSTLFALSDSISAPDLPSVEEWSEKEKLRAEMDVLGFYVTGHPMAKYAGEIKKYTNTDTELISEIKERREVSIAGVVRSLSVKHTKNGSGIFGNLVLEDMKGSVEIVVFNDLLRKSLPTLEERVRLRATDILSLRERRNGSTIHISLSRESATKDSLLKLKRIVEAYPGKSLIRLHLETDCGEAVIELGDCGVDIQDGFIDAVGRLFGNRVLRLD